MIEYLIVLMFALNILNKIKHRKVQALYGVWWWDDYGFIDEKKLFDYNPAVQNLYSQLYYLQVDL